MEDNSAEFKRFSNLSMAESPKMVIKSNRCNRCYLVTLIISSILCLAVGILIGYFVSHNSKSDDNKTAPPFAVGSDKQSIQADIKKIINRLDKEKIKDNLRLYASSPRMSGTPGGNELVQILEQSWKQAGIDSVKVTPYDVLMSYPNSTNPNKIQLISGNKVIFESAPAEKPLDADSNKTTIVLPFNSFASAGVAEGDIVYVNYGRIEDFIYLTKNLSMDLTGKILIARYGKIFRGSKVANAEKYNASGIVMYTDPSDFNIDGAKTYPDSWWMPNTGVQRGTVGTDGDYLTPFYPAKDYAYRKKQKDVKAFRIPAQPISYGDAEKLLRELKGAEVPPDWKGKLNITYRFGPGFRNSNLKAKLTVNNFEEVRTIYNIIGYIKGSVEPDRYVILGNHHDTWVFGSIDPLSGAAGLTEIVHSMGDLLKQGLRPKRTIVFCSWGAEEPGLFGSTEWVEEYMKVLYERAIAYLNVDYACDYPYVLVAGTSPLLQDTLYESTKLVPNPNKTSNSKTLYDIWKQRAPGTNNEPSVYYSLGSGSDMATFYQRAGVPSLDMWFTYNEDEWPTLSYPVYHSAYETFYLYETYIDPDFSYALAMAQLWSTMAWKLANENVLKFDIRRYSSAITHFLGQLEKQFGKTWQSRNINIDALKSAARNLTDSANNFHTYVNNAEINRELDYRKINDKMIQFERAFIDPEGLPGRRIYKHVMFAPSAFDSYSDNSFPGIVDTMSEIENDGVDKWEQLKQQVSIATYTIQSAANTLSDIGL